MLYTIENETLKVVLTDLGAELQNIILKEDGSEYLWQGDPEFWSGRAFNLFPICGRLVGGKYTYKGKEYKMEIHGFLRKSVTSAEKVAKDSITFLLKDSEETRAQYPFSFEYRVTYSLSGNTLRTDYEAKNLSDTEMPFTYGGHPGFQVPLADGDCFEDFYLEFGDKKDAKQMVFSEACMYTEDTVPFPLENGTVLPLRHSLFDNDAIFLRDMSESVTLKSKNGKKSVTVSYPGFPYLGLWHAPRKPAPYLCIEPWAGIPSYEGVVDDLDTKKDMLRLAPGAAFSVGFDIIIR